MKYIGLISDTHGSFTDEFREFLSPVDEIWHAGDFGGGLETAFKIASFKPLKGVYGNIDDQMLRFDYPEYQYFECEGMTVLMMHIGGYPEHYDPRARRLIEGFHPDIFVCGHSHILRVMRDQSRNMMVFNPGACGCSGFHTVRTALRFKIDSGKVFEMEVFQLPRR